MVIMGKAEREHKVRVLPYFPDGELPEDTVRRLRDQAKTPEEVRVELARIIHKYAYEPEPFTGLKQALNDCVSTLLSQELAKEDLKTRVLLNNCRIELLEIEVKPRNFKLVDRLEAHLKEINNE